MSSNNPVTRVRNDALEKFILEVAPETEAIRAALAIEERGFTDGTLVAGHKLSQVREKLRERHGLWLPWLKVSFSMSVTTARRYMNLFQLSKSSNLEHLKICRSALYLLAEASTPDYIRDDIMRRAEAGEEFLVADVATMIAAAKAFLRAPVQSELEQRRVSKAAHEDTVSRPPPPQPSNAENVARVERDAAQEIALGLKNLAFQLRRCDNNADRLVEKLSADEREAAREGIEAAMLIKAALDKLSAGWTDQAVTIFPNWKPRG